MGWLEDACMGYWMHGLKVDPHCYLNDRRFSGEEPYGNGTS
jgi:hypothetical protein